MGSSLQIHRVPSAAQVHSQGAGAQYQGADCTGYGTGGAG